MLSEQGVPGPDTRPESMPSPVVLRFSATFGPQGGHLVAVPCGGDLHRGSRAIGWGLSWRGSRTTFPLNWTRMPRPPCGTVAALEGRRGGRSQSACLTQLPREEGASGRFGYVHVRNHVSERDLNPHGCDLRRYSPDPYRETDNRRSESCMCVRGPTAPKSQYATPLLASEFAVGDAAGVR